MSEKISASHDRGMIFIIILTWLLGHGIESASRNEEMRRVIDLPPLSFYPEELQANRMLSYNHNSQCSGIVNCALRIVISRGISIYNSQYILRRAIFTMRVSRLRTGGRAAGQGSALRGGWRVAALAGARAELLVVIKTRSCA